MTEAVAPSRLDTVQTELEQARKSAMLQSLQIPPCPELLVRLREALSHAEPDLNEVARIATSDVAMSATLIKAANSPVHAQTVPVQTLGAALNVLGLDESATLMTRFLAMGAIKVPSNPSMQRFWERSTKRSTAMVYLSKAMPGIHADVAQTYGLFCHVGFPVMLQSVKGYAGTLVEAAARIDRPFIATENANHKTDHAVVGALVAKVWKLSPLVSSAIRLHHDLDLLRKGEAADADVINLIAAGLVAERLMRRHEGLPDDAEWMQHGEAALNWLFVGEQELATWEDELRDILDAV
jgi:HD-like signal output (HDOD) protein